MIAIYDGGFAPYVAIVALGVAWTWGCAWVLTRIVPADWWPGKEGEL